MTNSTAYTYEIAHRDNTYTVRAYRADLNAKHTVAEFTPRELHRLVDNGFLSCISDYTGLHAYLVDRGTLPVNATQGAMISSY